MLATEFNILKIEIQSIYTGNKVDVRYLTSEFNVSEDIYNDSVSGSIVIQEANDLIINLPIYGYELLTVEFKAPTDNKTYSKTFRIYKVEARKREKVRSEVYILNFCSIEQFANEDIRVSKSYQNQTIDTIANNVMVEYMKSRFFELEPNKFQHNIIFPSIDPFSCINWLASRSNSAIYNGATTLFYENRDGYNFVSLESRFDKPTKRVLTQSIPNFIAPKNNPDAYQNNILEDILIIQDYRFETVSDSMTNVDTGMFGSRLKVHSIIEKKWREYDFDYLKTYDKFKHTEPVIVKNVFTGQSGQSKLGGTGLNSPDSNLKIFPVEFIKIPESANTTDGSVRFTEKMPRVKDLNISGFTENGKNSLGPKIYPIPRDPKAVRISRITTPPSISNKRQPIILPSQSWSNPSDVQGDTNFSTKERSERWMLQRMSQLQAINDNIRLVCSIPGTVDLTIGDMVQVDLISPEPPINNKVVPDFYYKGSYMVTACRHKISQDAYITVLELVKDSVSAPYPDAT